MPQPYPLSQLTPDLIRRIDAVGRQLVSEKVGFIDIGDLTTYNLPCTDPVFDYLSDILSRATMRNVVQLNVIDDRPKERHLMDGADDCSPFERNLRVTAVRASKQSAAPLILPYPYDAKNDPAMDGLTADQKLANLKAIEIQERTRKHAVQTLSATISVSAKAERLHRRRVRGSGILPAEHLRAIAAGEVEANATQLRALQLIVEQPTNTEGTDSRLSHLSDADLDEQLRMAEEGDSQGLSHLPMTK